MSIGLPIMDFIALCVITAEYNLDIPIDELILKSERDEKSGLREFFLDPNNFSDYFFIIGTRLEYFDYGEWNQISNALYHIPKQKTVFSDMTLRQWISPMLVFTWIDSNDSDDEIYTEKNAIRDEYFSDKHCREYSLRSYSEKVFADGCRFNLNFRKILKNSETLTSTVLTNFFESDNYAQYIVQLYSRQSYIS